MPAGADMAPFIGPPHPPRLLDQLRTHLRTRHYSIRTEQVYVDWVRRFIKFHGFQHPKDLGPAAVEAFLSHLAVERNVSASTQNQAKAALLYLYKQVLALSLPWLDDVVQAKVPRRLPVVLTEREVRELLLALHGPMWLIASLLYGTGMRLLECLRLRVKDVEFSRREIIIREGKGNKDRVTVLPEGLVPALRTQLSRAHAVHQKDLAAGFGDVFLPDALATKFPNAGRAWGWQYVFPAANRALDPRGQANVVCEAGVAPRVAPFVRHAPAAGGLRHPHGAGTAGTRGRQHNDDLHPRAQPGRSRYSQPAGRALARCRRKEYPVRAPARCGNCADIHRLSPVVRPVCSPGALP